MSKDINVSERIFNAFHNYLITIKSYGFHGDHYRRNGFRAILRRNKKGIMNEPMAREFKQFLEQWLEHGKKFIEVLS